MTTRFWLLVTLFTLIFFCLFGENAYPTNLCVRKQIKIAVIDTGFGYHGKGKDVKLCQSGHVDFTQKTLLNQTVFPQTGIPEDDNSHGTNVAGIIDDILRKTKIDYCIVILKFYGETKSFTHNAGNTVEAIKYATEKHYDYINYSAGGTENSISEKLEINKFLNQGGVFVTAAGNEGLEIGPGKHSYYPAMHDKRLIVVGSLDAKGKRLSSSNFGSIVNRWELGLMVVSQGIMMTGTSQATAIATGKIISKKGNKCLTEVK